MAHFAKIQDGVVQDVIVAEQDFIDAYCEGAWVQTSYNTFGGVHYSYREVEQSWVEDNGETTTVTSLERYDDGGIALRKNYAGIGFTYDSERDAFYAPQPYASWTLNENTCLWEAPTAYPDDSKIYNWDEDTTSWVEVE
tara:strand:- start:27 stop:443 length:417 start_codon:yes stop_codon:yes gene_type:complete